MDNNKADFFKNLSLFEKIFWITLSIFFALYLFFILMASKNSTPVSNEKNITVPSSQEIIHEVEIIVNSDRFKKNLENNETLSEIKENLTKGVDAMDKKIDKEISDAFSVAYGRIDSFLDFHYSVVGEYAELGSMAAGTIGKSIEEKLFGPLFSRHLQSALDAISNQYKDILSSHFDLIRQKATAKVDIELNSHIVSDLQKQIEQNIKIQSGKIAVLATAKLAPKIAKAAGTKIAAKSSSKIAAKIAAKLGTRTAAAATGAASGALCGPFVWVCSPVAATLFWFGTDVAINSVDEYYNRDEFRQDIVKSLKLQESRLKSRLKKEYQESAYKLSHTIQTEYKKTQSRERKRVKIKERIGF